MYLRLIALAAALAGTAAGSVAAAQNLPLDAHPAMQQRSEGGSDANLRGTRRRLETVIDQLQRDRRDYDGHRVKAIQDLQMARGELDAALQYDSRR